MNISLPVISQAVDLSDGSEGADLQLRPIDHHAGKIMERLMGRKDAVLYSCTACTSWALSQGHTCLPLDILADWLEEEQVWPSQRKTGKKAKDRSKGKLQGKQLSLDYISAASIDTLAQHLMDTGMVGQDKMCTPRLPFPLVLDDQQRLYLRRAFWAELEIAQGIIARMQKTTPVDIPLAKDLLSQVFPSPKRSLSIPEDSPVNWQKTAAALALVKNFLLISGGPGTGKTYTVARILALLGALQKNPLRIGLAAPTGKAAARMQEAIRSAKTTLPPHLAQYIPDQEAFTLHRLLGYQPEGGRRGLFHHNHDNPLPLDLLLVDEASMVDIQLMAALEQALPAEAKLILLGDRHQLPSVGAGNVFADCSGDEQPPWSGEICALLSRLTGEKYAEQAGSSPLSLVGDSSVTLQTSYRFSAQSGIGRLADAIKQEDASLAKQVLQASYADVETYEEAEKEREVSSKEGEQERDKYLIQMFTPVLRARSVQDALAELDKHRVLCALHEGRQGVKAVNRRCEELLRRHKYISAQGRLYKGKPIMITQNHYNLQLFNGDTGIIWPDEQDTTGKLYAWFYRSGQNLCRVSPLRLPEYTDAYAITIHKSQGSEFSQVLLILPQRETAVLSRELIYTGITRARHKLILETSPEVLQRGLSLRNQRFSGLAAKIQKGQRG